MYAHALARQDDRYTFRGISPSPSAISRLRTIPPINPANASRRRISQRTLKIYTVELFREIYVASGVGED